MYCVSHLNSPVKNLVSSGVSLVREAPLSQVKSAKANGTEGFAFSFFFAGSCSAAGRELDEMESEAFSDVAGCGVAAPPPDWALSCSSSCWMRARISWSCLRISSFWLLGVATLAVLALDPAVVSPEPAAKVLTVAGGCA